MKKIAIISDIHANYEALTVVLDDIKQKNVDAIYCLGDVIGYGPSPIECLQKTVEICSFILLGNHEEAVLAGAFGFNPSAKQAIDWTRSKVKPKFYHLNFTKRKRYWEGLMQLPLCYTEERNLFVHASPLDPTMDYILKSDTEDVFGEIPEKITQIFEQIDNLCFVGHTHMPGIITEKSEWYSPEEFDLIWEYGSNDKLICNVGSVGQPRDKNRDSCYVILEEKRICYHRVPYDYEKTQEKIYKIPQLDNRNARRLGRGS